jgi:hypothetical protein
MTLRQNIPLLKQSKSSKGKYDKTLKKQKDKVIISKELEEHCDDDVKFSLPLI